MSDTFDHEADAYDSYYWEDNEESRNFTSKSPKGWYCPKCNRWHPHIHKSCWYCSPPKVDKKLDIN